MSWPSAELDMLLSHVEQLADDDEKHSAFGRVLGTCEADRLEREHPFHPGVLIRLLTLAGSLGVRESAVRHIQRELFLLTMPSAVPGSSQAAARPIIHKVELLGLTLLDAFLPTVQATPEWWTKLARALFDAHDDGSDEINEQVWSKRFSRNVGWRYILEHVRYLKPWRELILDACRRIAYTSFLFWNPLSNSACALPVRIDIEHGEDEETIHVEFSGIREIDGGHNIEICPEFAEAASQAALFGREAALHAHGDRVTGSALVLKINVRLAEEVLAGVARTLEIDSHPVLFQDTSIMLPVALATYSRLTGRDVDGPVVATGSLRWDDEKGAVAEWRNVASDDRRHDLMETIAHKVALVQRSPVYDRLFLPKGMDPAILRDAYDVKPGVYPFIVIQVDALSACLDVWEDCSQRAWRFLEDFADLPRFPELAAQLNGTFEGRSMKLLYKNPIMKWLYGG